MEVKNESKMKSAGSNKTQISVRLPTASGSKKTPPPENAAGLLSAEHTGFSDLITPSPQKQRKQHNVSIMSRPTSVKPKRLYETEDPLQKRKLAGIIIENAWLAYRDKNMFRLLKHAICAAETSLTHEVLRKVSPKEAHISKDPSISLKIRFRFGGREFPPLIYFKIFSSSKDGSKMLYMSGKKVIRPETEAARDACDRMGNRKYYELIIQDSMQHEHYKVTDEMDITTLKDYMQYSSNLDELPAYKGGRDNMWRLLTLDVVPRQTIFYDVLDFLYTRKLTTRLKKVVPTLVARPVTQEVQLQHIEVITRPRTPSPERKYPTRLATRQRSDVTSRRSQQAVRRAEKMKKMYAGEPEMKMEHEDELCDDVQEDEWEQEADELYAWTRALDDQTLETPKL